MGLDMYLTKRTYIGANYEHNKVKVNIEAITVDGKPIHINPKRITYIEEQVGYWRKANQIHRWFVESVQGGNDNCGTYSVTREGLESLLKECKYVRDNPKEAEGQLPAKEGFFFGDTKYDEYYFVCIDDTIKLLEKVLAEPYSISENDFQYSSSW